MEPLRRRTCASRAVRPHRALAPGLLLSSPRTGGPVMTRHGGVFAALAAAAGLACAPPTAPVREIDKAETAVKSAERENKTQEAAGLQTTMARERRERAAEAE